MSRGEDEVIGDEGTATVPEDVPTVDVTDRGHVGKLLRVSFYSTNNELLRLDGALRNVSGLVATSGQGWRVNQGVDRPRVHLAHFNQNFCLFEIKKFLIEK